jgi:hypothetical protein
MTRTNNFNMDYRPRSYWPASNQNYDVGTKVKGELRRKVARKIASEGINDTTISAEKISEEHLTAVGRVHPMFMVGEYLPDQYGNETEIARVTMQSVTMDVISVRARKTKHRISTA